MISNAVSVRRRMPLAPRLSLVFALGAAIAWQPALAGVSQSETAQSLSGSPSIVLPGAQSGEQGSLTGSAKGTEAPIVVADNNLKISGDNKNKKKNNNNNNTNGNNNNNTKIIIGQSTIRTTTIGTKTIISTTTSTLQRKFTLSRLRKSM